MKKMMIVFGLMFSCLNIVFAEEIKEEEMEYKKLEIETNYRIFSRLNKDSYERRLCIKDRENMDCFMDCEFLLTEIENTIVPFPDKNNLICIGGGGFSLNYYDLEKREENLLVEIFGLY